ncbi:SUMF1/EgtB/PvdO family nonheme iron enzyme [Bacillus sp. OHL2]
MDIEEAFSFCQWLSGKLGIDVSIPTEEEWEYAARGTREINTRGEMSLILLTAIRTNQILKKRRLSVITKRADPYLVFMIWGQCRGMGQHQISRI